MTVWPTRVLATNDHLSLPMVHRSTMTAPVVGPRRAAAGCAGGGDELLGLRTAGPAPREARALSSRADRVRHVPAAIARVAPVQWTSNRDPAASFPRLCLLCGRGAVACGEMEHRRPRFDHGWSSA